MSSRKKNIAFLKELKIEYICVDKNHPDPTKRVIGIDKGYSEEEAAMSLNFATKTAYVARKYMLCGTPYAVIDIDTNDFGLDSLKEMCNIESLSMKGNSKGHHVWVKFNSIEDKPSHSNIQKCMKHCEGDYLGEKVFEKVRKEWKNKPICLMDDELMNKCFVMNKIVKVDKKIIGTNEYDTIDHDILLRICDLISPEYLEDRKRFLSIICAIRNCGIDIDFARFFATRTEKYDKACDTYGINSPEDFETIWNSPNVNTTAGTIRHFARESNEKKYKELINQSIIDDEELLSNCVYTKTDKSFADLIIKIMFDDLIYTENNKLYICYNNFWKNDDGLIMNISQRRVNELCNDYDSRLTTQRNSNLDNEELIKEYTKKLIEVNKTIMSIGSSKKIESILKQIKISMKTLQKNINFDTYTPHIFCFNNVSYDLNTRQIYNVKKEDYITQKCGYDYQEPTDEDVEKIGEIFDSIFPDKDMKKTYISVLRTGLSGKREEKLFMANGGGRNGKGVLNELMMDCVGLYGKKLNISVLTDKIKAGANVEVSNCNLKRFVTTNEPNDNESILAGNIKRLTGDHTIAARGIYSSSEETILCLTLLLELNKMINLMGRIDDAIVGRLVTILFSVFFTNDEEQLKINPNARKANQFYKTAEFRQKYKHALFKFLLDSPKELYICEKAKQDTRDYLLDNDDMYNWFIDNYEKVTGENADQTFVTIHDVFFKWKESELYLNLSKANKRKANMKNFKQNCILDNNEMKKYYVEKKNIADKNGKATSRSNVIICWKPKSSAYIGIVNDDELE